MVAWLPDCNVCTSDLRKQGIDQMTIAFDCIGVKKLTPRIKNVKKRVFVWKK